MIKRGVDEVHPDDPQCLLLARVVLVPHPGVNDDVDRRTARNGLKPDPEPAMTFFLARVTFRGHGVGEHEKCRLLAARLVEPLQQQAPFVVEHRLQPFPADVPFHRAVDGVGHRHVVGRYRFGHRAGRAADPEKPPGHLLSRADLRERAVLVGVEVDGQRLLMSIRMVFVHGGTLSRRDRAGFQIGMTLHKARCPSHKPKSYYLRRFGEKE